MLIIIISILSILSIVLFIYFIIMPEDEKCPKGGWHEYNEIKLIDNYYKTHKFPSSPYGVDYKCSKCGKIINE